MPPIKGRTAAARRLDVLANEFFVAKKNDPRRAELFTPIIEHISKLVASQYWSMRLNKINLELDDFRQEVALKLWSVAKYYDPARGAFVSFAIRVIRQVGSACIKRHYAHSSEEISLSDSYLYEQAPVVDAKFDAAEVEQTLTKVVGAFVDFCNVDSTYHEVAATASAFVTSGHPLPFDLATILGCSRHQAVGKVKELLSMFSGYLEVYEGVVDRESWTRKFR